MSTFQEKYPLCVGKKFTKKMIEKLPRCIGVSWLLSLFILAILPQYINFIKIEFSFTSLFELTGIIFTLLITGFAIYYKIYITTYKYDSVGEFISIKKGVFAPQEIYVQYQKIQDIYVDQDILDRILGIYDVHIASATAASAVEAHIDGISKENADSLKKYFLNLITQESSSKEKVVEVSNTHIMKNINHLISNTEYPMHFSWIYKSVLEQLVYSIFIGIGVMGVFWWKNNYEMLNIKYYLIFTLASWVLFSVSQIIWKFNYSFEFTEEFIRFRSGVLSISERHLPYKSIQDVSKSQSLLDRIFGLVNVNIENAAQIVAGNQNVNSTLELVGLNHAQADRIIEQIKNKMSLSNSKQLGL